MKENNGMPKKETKPNYLNQKRQAVIAFRSKLNKHGQFHIAQAISFISLETGLGKTTLQRIVNDMLVTGEIIIDGDLAVKTEKNENVDENPI